MFLFNEWLFIAYDEDKGPSSHMWVNWHRLLKYKCWVSTCIHGTWKLDTKDRSIPCGVIGVTKCNR